MTLDQCEKRNERTIENATRWAEGKECDPLTILDVAIMAEYCKVNLPKSFHNFVNSRDRNSVNSTGAHKTIFKTMDKLREEILKV